MGGVHQATYLTSKKIALDWWKSLPLDALQVAAEDGNGNRQPATTISYHEDRELSWVVWRKEVPHSEVLVVAWQQKDDKPKWRIDVTWHGGRTSATRTTAEIVKKALIDLGADCIFDSAPDKK